jgi:dihydroorotate dehydrogenase
VKLLGIEFGRVFCAAGARNFHGDKNAYWFHRYLRPFGLDWRGSTFVAKTTTLEARAGNLPLGGRSGTTPRERFPQCIKVNWRAGAVLNAVGLSGPGLEALLADGRWQARREPFVVSFAAVGPHAYGRSQEVRDFASILAVARLRQQFRLPIAVELNSSCPNVGHDSAEIAGEVRGWLADVRGWMPRVPLIPKINALVPVAVARSIAEHPACDAVVVSNTIPWGALPDRIDWRGLFGEVSPLAHLGGGGLSGAPLLPIVADWVAGARKEGFPKPLIAGGGILSVADAHRMIDAGADAIELGSVAILRPWRVRGVIRFADYRLRRLEDINVKGMIQ